MYYAIGVGMGVLAVMFIFGDREIGCSYFPNDRVLSDLRKKELIISPDIQLQMNSAGMDTSDISVLLERGKVNFDEVDRGLDTCKTYWIKLEEESKSPFSALFQNCDSTATILELDL